MYVKQGQDTEETINLEVLKDPLVNKVDERPVSSEEQISPEILEELYREKGKVSYRKIITRNLVNLKTNHRKFSN